MKTPVTPVSLQYPKRHVPMIVSVFRLDPSATTRGLFPLAIALFEPHDAARRSIHLDCHPRRTVFRSEHGARQHDVRESRILALSQSQARCLRGLLVELGGDGAHVC